MRKIIYVSGTRADFGLMESTLSQATQDPNLDISVCVTGMHLSPQYGNTYKEIEKSGLRICSKISVDLKDTSGASMARSIGTEIINMVDAFQIENPDLVMVLGDRGEQLAGALAAIHLNIPLAHIHGGERSGTVDEPIRHAISKLSHYHFVTTEKSKERLIRMGELEKHIFVTGAPGLDGINQMVQFSKQELCDEYNFDSSKTIALVIFHPVLQEEKNAGSQMQQLLDALSRSSLQSLILMPNSDAGANSIREAVDKFSQNPYFRRVVHLPRKKFISWLAAVDVMIGNSSSGIIESASFNLPTVNIGSRQKDRERNDNVIDTLTNTDDIKNGIYSALKLKGNNFKNIYGDGKSGEKIISLLKTLSLNSNLLNKTNSY